MSWCNSPEHRRTTWVDKYFFQSKLFTPSLLNMWTRSPFPQPRSINVWFLDSPFSILSSSQRIWDKTKIPNFKNYKRQIHSWRINIKSTLIYGKSGGVCLIQAGDHTSLLLSQGGICALTRGLGLEEPHCKLSAQLWTPSYVILSFPPQEDFFAIPTIIFVLNSFLVF